MEAIKPNPIIKFNDNQMQLVRKAVGYEDLNKLIQDLDQLEDWIQKQNHFTVKTFDRTFLERFLIYNKGSIEKAKQKLDKFCTFNNLMPDFLQNFDIKNEFEHLRNMSNSCVLPKPTFDNYRVIVTNATGFDNPDWSFIGYYRYLIMACEYMMFNDYCCGYEMIADPRKVLLSTVKKFNPIVMHKGLTLLVEALGQRVKKIHMVAGSKFFETLLMIFKQGLSAKLSKRLIVHSTQESLYEHIPKEILPSDLGGDERSMKELSDEQFEEYCTDEHINHVKFLESIKTDEDLRLVGTFNEEYSGMPGSFKTLCVD